MRLGADLYLAWRALVVQPLRRIFGKVGRGEACFLENYGPEGLVPTPAKDKAMVAAASRCISCGLCDQIDGQLGAISRGDYDGVSLLPRQYARSSVELVHARRAVEAIDPERYRAAEAICPTGVPLVALAGWLRDRLLRARSAAKELPDGVRDDARAAPHEAGGAAAGR
ncbi:MAG TPA: (Fe-S)-binding protein [Vulgatibacter sp.]|nr:(Fe-S)-binding protein [Vulgatibacter sp.]